MSSIMHNIWDCYLPFVRRYGDNIAAAFDSLPVLDLPEVGIICIERRHLNVLWIHYNIHISTNMI